MSYLYSLTPQPASFFVTCIHSDCVCLCLWSWPAVWIVNAPQRLVCPGLARQPLVLLEMVGLFRGRAQKLGREGISYQSCAIENIILALWFLSSVLWSETPGGEQLMLHHALHTVMFGFATGSRAKAFGNVWKSESAETFLPQSWWTSVPCHGAGTLAHTESQLH